jgi:ATP-dependent RNA helicase RhlE
VEIAPAGTAADTIAQELFIVKNENKDQLLQRLLEQYHGTVLLFARTKAGTNKLKRKVAAMGHTSAEIHSDRSLGQRKQALEGFKLGRFRVLVATDVAARGIDVTGIELVINYDLPDEAESYVHRIGRTGRAGQIGRAISFAMPDQLQGVRNIERLIRTTLPISKHPDVPNADFFKHTAFRYVGRSQRSQRRRGGHGHYR